jgi:predicted Fe-Mo cluster-binding NifX family protein
MKIAVITDDGKSISQNFGRAAAYLILTIEGGKIINRETRDKLVHNQSSVIGHVRRHDVQQEMDEASNNKHAQMVGSISDCEVLLCGGMGMSAYQNMRKQKIQAIITTVRDIEEAVATYLDGKLVDHIEKLH